MAGLHLQRTARYLPFIDSRRALVPLSGRILVAVQAAADGPRKNTFSASHGAVADL